MCGLCAINNHSNPKPLPTRRTVNEIKMLCGIKLKGTLFSKQIEVWKIFCTIVCDHNAIMTTQKWLQLILSLILSVNNMKNLGLAKICFQNLLETSLKIILGPPKFRT